MHRITSDSGRKRRATASLIWLESTLLEPSRVLPVEHSQKPPPLPLPGRTAESPTTTTTTTTFPRVSFPRAFIPPVLWVFVAGHASSWKPAPLHSNGGGGGRLDCGKLGPEFVNLMRSYGVNSMRDTRDPRESLALGDFN